VQITWDPGRVGVNSVQAVVYGPDGGLSTVPELRLTLTLPARGIGPLDTFAEVFFLCRRTAAAIRSM
jgi:copper transport protein